MATRHRKLGTFGAAGPARSLVTGQTLKPTKPITPRLQAFKQFDALPPVDARTTDADLERRHDIIERMYPRPKGQA